MTQANFTYEVIRSARRKKSAAIQIKHGQVQILIPQRMTQAQVNDLVRRKTPWIEQKLKDIQQRPPIQPKHYVSGESFTYLGRHYRLKLTETDARQIQLQGGRLVLGLAKSLAQAEQESFVQNALLEWYIAQATEKLAEKTERYAKIIGVKPKSVQVKSYKSRWGSCSVKGDIAYNWKIIIAPHSIVDSVVIHELCHILHHNHSEAFWKTVERFDPEYQNHRQWLKTNGQTLRI